MNKHNDKPEKIMKHLTCITTIVIASTIMLFTACDEGTKPSPDPPALTLELYVIGGVPEVVVDSNCYIGGVVKNSRDVAETGHRVDFTINRTGIGITPYAATDLNTESGFDRTVVFNHHTLDTVIVTGTVGNTASYDMQVIIKDPSNEN